MTDPDLTARWFLVRSDVEAAARVEGVSEKVQSYIARHWPHWACMDCYNAVYREAGKIEAEQQDTFQKIPQQSRYVVTSQVIQTRLLDKLPPDCRVMDYGASRGLWAINLANQMPGLKHWTLVEHDELSLDGARKFVGAHAVGGHSWDYVCGDWQSLPDETWNLSLVMDVLEHVPDPYETMAAIEARTNGFVIVSLPYGPHEYEMWIRHPERKREHIREWCYPDIMEIFAGKKDVEVFHIAYGPISTDEAIGHHIIKYRADGEPLKPINWDRKLNKQQFRAVALPD